MLVIGRVLDVLASEGKGALSYWQGQYIPLDPNKSCAGFRRDGYSDSARIVGRLILQVAGVGAMLQLGDDLLQPAPHGLDLRRTGVLLPVEQMKVGRLEQHPRRK